MSVELRIIADADDGHDIIAALTRGLPGWRVTEVRGPHDCRGDSVRRRWYLGIERLPDGVSGLASIVEDALSQT